MSWAAIRRQYGTVYRMRSSERDVLVHFDPLDDVLGLRSRWAYRVDQSDSDGSFQLSTIPAGDYYFVILSDGADILYREPPSAAALAKVAKIVHVAPGDHQTIEAE
jgi:hypothetical protein